MALPKWVKGQADKERVPRGAYLAELPEISDDEWKAAATQYLEEALILDAMGRKGKPNALVRSVATEIQVKNLVQSIDWYSRMLGLHAKEQPPDRARRSPTLTGPVRMNASDKRTAAVILREARKRHPKVSLYFSVLSDIDKLYKSVRRKGAKIEATIEDVGDGTRQFRMIDPDGHEVNVAQEAS